jgi:hypothetical protein
MSKALPTTVYIEEEYGYRYWVWESDKTPDQLTEWWQALESVEPYSVPDNLPGKVREVDSLPGKNGVWFCHLHTEDDSYLRSPEGEIIHHAGWVPE